MGRKLYYSFLLAASDYIRLILLGIIQQDKSMFMFIFKLKSKRTILLQQVEHYSQQSSSDWKLTQGHFVFYL
jgi:hypothetical protein